MTSIVKGVLQQTKFCAKWRIERFYEDCEKVGDSYKSPVFLIPNDKKFTKWYLVVYPRGYKVEDKDYISLFLHLESERACDITVDYELILSSKQNVSLTELGNLTIHSFKGRSDNWGWWKFLKHDFIKDEKNGILIDDTLTILCEIAFPHEPLDAALKSKDYNNLLNKIGKGLQNYEELFESDRFSDVEFIIQNEKMYLHKAILSCKNSVFNSMFKSETKVVKIKDVDYEVMKEVFRFIYSGKVINIEKIAKPLMIAADKYSVTDLKALCEMTLAKTLHIDLTIDSLVEYLKLTKICETTHLKPPVIQFAVANRKDIIKDPGFQDLDNTVMFQIMQELVEKF